MGMLSSNFLVCLAKDGFEYKDKVIIFLFEKIKPPRPGGFIFIRFYLFFTFCLVPHVEQLAGEQVVFAVVAVVLPCSFAAAGAAACSSAVGLPRVAALLAG